MLCLSRHHFLEQDRRKGPSTASGISVRRQVVAFDDVGHSDELMGQDVFLSEYNPVLVVFVWNPVPSAMNACILIAVISINVVCIGVDAKHSNARLSKVLEEVL